MAKSLPNLQSNSRHPFRKKWGQNFLRDPNIITKIISCLKPKRGDEILEIGPGDGALTDQLVKRAAQIHAVEIDPFLVKYLTGKHYPNLILHQVDFLDWDISILSKAIKVVGNLPYYISSPILFKLLESDQWERMVLMFQKEVAQRIVSKPGTKTYGKLSVMCQVFCDVKIEFIVSKNVFQPKPDVDSAVLIFLPKNTTLPEIILFSKFVKQAFSQRRKKLKNNLPEAYHAGVLENWADLRPEELSPCQYIQIYKRI